MTEPTTKAARGVLAANIFGEGKDAYHAWIEMDWDDARDLYIAIEAEAREQGLVEAIHHTVALEDETRAAERERIAAAVKEWASGGTNLCNSCYMPMARHDADCRVAAILAIVRGDEP